MSVYFCRVVEVLLSAYLFFCSFLQLFSCVVHCTLCLLFQFFPVFCIIACLFVYFYVAHQSLHHSCLVSSRNGKPLLLLFRPNYFKSGPELRDEDESHVSFVCSDSFWSSCGRCTTTGSPHHKNANPRTESTGSQRDSNRCTPREATRTKSE